ncbi:MAG: 1,4-alpha-glucan branching protein domain-containing protein [Planctomycetota bacterium]|jgi:1,4-alpha-glucan branching enzyme
MGKSESKREDALDTAPICEGSAASADAEMDGASNSSANELDAMPVGDRPSGGESGIYQASESGAGDGPDFSSLIAEPFLPDTWNETYLYLIPRDPESMLAIWEVGEATRLDLTGRFGDDFFASNDLVLRVYQVTGVDFDGVNSNHIFEVSDELHWKNSYWVKVYAGEDYIAEIGYRAAGTTFFEVVARSNPIHIPRAVNTDGEVYAEWSQIEVDANEVEVPTDPEGWRFNQYHYWKKRTHAAPEEKGFWSLVLHQHLPFVRHAEYDVALEEQWFFEAVVSVYTQFLNVLWNLEKDKVDFRITVSLTPPLLSMMQDPLLQKRAARHIEECIALATRERDHAAGKPWYDTAEDTLRRFWIAKEVFEAYEGDLTRGYRDFQDLGKLEVITCPATHMLIPLYQHQPGAIRAQLATACKQYERVFGRAPRGIWLPENAYTPGIDAYLAEFDIKWTLISAVSMEQGDTKSFYNTARPVITPNGVACFGIDEDTRNQVWSREAGYPGHPDYKEWYRDLGYDADWDYLSDYWTVADCRRNTGIKYYRITKQGADLGEKDYYNPAWARETVHAQAGQFVFSRGAQANHLAGEYHTRPCVVSAYDAELFGHWWEEGPMWLESVFRKLCFDQDVVRPCTPSEYLAEESTQQRMMPGAGSWGKKSYFGTWVDGREYQPNCWVWRHYYRICDRMVVQAAAHRETTDAVLERALNQAVREVFLACASDWGFLIETGQAVRYSELQIIRHLDRARELLRQIEAGEVDKDYLTLLEAADTAFPAPDLDFRTFA